MASNPTIPSIASKTSNTNAPKLASVSPSIPPQASNTGNEAGQRRGGGSGSFGAGAYSRPSVAPRNSSGKKTSSKASKRVRMDEYTRAEAAVMRSSANRRGQTSITHLMEFSHGPRPYLGSHRNYHRHQRSSGSSWHGHHSALDKSRYVHANYRFIVDPRQSYDHHKSDPDEYLDWDSILQILVSLESQSNACPICLDTPTAPRMAKCGHVFCAQCLLRFMHSEEEQPKAYEKKPRHKKCPLCWEPIYMSDVKPVRWYAGNEGPAPREGHDIFLRLMKRPFGSTLALPRDGGAALNTKEDIPWYFAAEVIDYAHIMRGTEDYMKRQIDKDIAAVEEQEQQNELQYGDDTSEWTKKAVRLLKEAKDKFDGIGGPREDEIQPAEPRPSRTSTTEERIPDDWRDESMDSTVSRALDSSESGDARSHPPSEYYFYQGLLHYYLCPLDIRILKEAFGSFSLFPSTILPRVERVSTGHVVDDELRKRSKWLSHLPRGCEVYFLECDWTDTVPSEFLAKFQVEIEKRRKRNHDKDAQDERARLRAEKEEDDKRYAHLRRRSPGEPSQQWFRDDEFQPLVSHDREEDGTEMPSSSPPWTNRQGAGFTSLAHMSTSPSTSRTVWGTAVIASTSPSLGAIADAANHSADDGWLQDWEKDLMKEDEELIAQAEALSLSEERTPAGGGKKKKPKKITLMSTNVRRGA
ncbi:hypothetical protein BT63DRAFT_583 [Microthyrium microscopicum]|uniref:RING-type domain-containing protein n=1 Tax=Microthyrium microscopicum TaxID=703497 RepID=A0A6A6URJ7_9PEZI|nr:hypothetical protein BT63DRAFT_583 [Microthyrium microscopicum]